MGLGYLRVEATTGEDGKPVLGLVTVTKDCQDVSKPTDLSGQTELFELEAPDAELSLDPEYEGSVYSVCDVKVVADRYTDAYIKDVQIYDGKTTLLPVDMIPREIGVDAENPPQDITIYRTDVNRRATMQDVPEEGTMSLILDRVVIPQYVTVHLGRPTASAQNVTVSFTHYIKNVCCSEIYPTWPRNALIANIYCQISLVLNRIFTEWYRSRGNPFDITNSTSYDQYFVYGRSIDSGVRKNNFTEPFYAEYCNGTTATCPGLKQWGTVTLANQGYTPLGILRYYYGSNISLVTTNNIEAVQSSYPGTALRVGSTGNSVSVIQQQLTRIRQNYPLIPSPGSIDGIYGASTAAAVRQFQSIFNLSSDGVVGSTTWYKISYIFTAVTKLAELGSEGLTTPDIIYPTPTTTVRYGNSGERVLLAQYLLYAAAEFYSRLNPLPVDGSFGSATLEAAEEFQALRGLTVDGVIGAATWAELYKVFYAYMNSINPVSPSYPGVALRVGSTGSSVATMQRYLNVIAEYFTSIPRLTIDAIYGSGTRAAVIAFQGLFGLTADGVIGPQTWNRIVGVYNDVVNY